MLFAKNEAYRLADEDAPEHTDEFHVVLFITALSSNYSEYINTFTIRFGHGRRPWSMPTRTRSTSSWEGQSTEELPRTRRSEAFSPPVGVGERIQEVEAAEAAVVRELRRENSTPPAAIVR